MTDSSEPLTAKPIARRTVLAGAAFAVPAIAITAGTPAFAASGPVLSFANSSYTGAACSTISGVQLRAMENGTPKANVAVTTTLAGSYTFSTGGTTSTGVTGTNGWLTLPDISVPSIGGNVAILAASAGASGASANLSATARNGVASLHNGAWAFIPGVPTGAKPIWNDLYLTGDNRLVTAGGSQVGTGIASAGQGYRDTSGNTTLPLVGTNGVAALLRNGAWVSVPNIPNGSTPIWNDLFLTSDNKLITAGGSVVGTGVGYAGQADRDTSGNTTLPLVGTNGVAAMLRNGAWVSIPNVPNGSKPIWNDLYLTSDNKLVTAGGSTVGTGLASAGQADRDTSGNTTLPLVGTNGVAALLRNGAWVAIPNVPNGSRPVWNDLFLTADDKLITAGGSEVGSALGSAGQADRDTSGNTSLPLVGTNGVAALLRNGAWVSLPAVPSGSKPVWNDLFLTYYGDLVTAWGSQVGTGIAFAGQADRDTSGNTTLPLVGTNGVAAMLRNGAWVSVPNIPNGSKPIWNDLYLTSDNRLITAGGSVVGAGIGSAGQGYRDASGNTTLPLVGTNGVAAMLRNGAWVSVPNIPNGSKPIWNDLYLTSDNRLITAGGSVVGTGIGSAGQGDRDASGNTTLPLVGTNGVAAMLRNGAWVSVPNIPNGSKPVWDDLFLTPDNKLITAGGSVVGTGISVAGQADRDASGNTTLPLALTGCV
ncbi:hypothetical protein [Microbacterium sp. BH-3-3-3]|uniref:hypothetical protein n=1 Tax=Microbacterium sp. BH-3-3-3 TaxID=1906742 RepID=UPI0011A2C6E8|nr:hypothetical protein [Microbacterium sp. BH-3-3-3]